jgi:hypothetical protein
MPPAHSLPTQALPLGVDLAGRVRQGGVGGGSAYGFLEPPWRAAAPLKNEIAAAVQV